MLHSSNVYIGAIHRLPRLVRNPNCNPKSGPSSPDSREAKQRSLYKTCEAPSGFPTLMPAVPAMLNNNKQSAQARIVAFSKQGSPSLSVGCMQTFVKHSRSLVASLLLVPSPPNMETVGKSILCGFMPLIYSD